MKRLLGLVFMLALAASCGDPEDVARDATSAGDRLRPAATAALPTIPTGWIYPTGSADFCGYLGWLGYNREFAGYHLGQDMCAAQGAPIYALGDGEILVSDTCVGGYGPPDGSTCGGAVIGRSQAADGVWFTWLVGHLNSPRGVGAVSAGDVVGYANGWIPPHAHFAVHPGQDLAPAADRFRGYTANTANTYGFTDPIAFLNAHARTAPCQSPGFSWIGKFRTSRPVAITQAPDGALIVIHVTDDNGLYASRSDGSDGVRISVSATSVSAAKWKIPTTGKTVTVACYLDLGGVPRCIASPDRFRTIQTLPALASSEGTTHLAIRAQGDRLYALVGRFPGDPTTKSRYLYKTSSGTLGWSGATTVAKGLPGGVISVGWLQSQDRWLAHAADAQVYERTGATGAWKATGINHSGGDIGSSFDLAGDKRVAVFNDAAVSGGVGRVFLETKPTSAVAGTGWTRRDLPLMSGVGTLKYDTSSGQLFVVAPDPSGNVCAGFTAF